MWPFRRRKHLRQAVVTPLDAVAPSVSTPVTTPRLRAAPPADLPPEASLRLRLRGLSADGRLSVVGESHYQPALADAAKGLAAGDSWEEKIPVVAVLVPEPENPYDEYAVRVDVLTDFEPLTVGYLASSEAEEYQPPLLRLREQGWLGTCPARITGGGQKYYGIYLHLAPADCLHIANSVDGLTMLDPDRIVAVTQEERHQAALDPFAPTGGELNRRVAVELIYCTISRGKYRGQRAVEVRLNGNRIGELTFGMTERYCHLIDDALVRGTRPGCEALIFRGERGIEVELRLPTGVPAPA